MITHYPYNMLFDYSQPADLDAWLDDQGTGTFSANLVDDRLLKQFAKHDEVSVAVHYYHDPLTTLDEVTEVFENAVSNAAVYGLKIEQAFLESETRPLTVDEADAVYDGIRAIP